MKAINRIIKEGLVENKESLMRSLMKIGEIAKYTTENKDFNFDIDISYNRQSDLLKLTYDFKEAEKHISISFQMSELFFNYNCINISTTLIDYAISYFNDSDFKVNIGDFDGDCYVEIKEYIESLYNKDEKSNLMIIDIAADKML